MKFRVEVGDKQKLSAGLSGLSEMFGVYALLTSLGVSPVRMVIEDDGERFILIADE
jgi:hypothetical protein